MRTVFAALAFVLTAACSGGEPPSPPDYDKPLDGVAFKAFKAAMKADWLDKPYDLGDGPPESANAMNYQQSVDWNNKQLANKKAPKVYKALRRLNIGDCVWQKFRERDVPAWSKERITEAPHAVYKCAFTLHYRINPPHGSPESVESEGFFYKNGRDFVYIGKFDHTY